MENIIRVGIGALVVKDGKMLYGLRKSEHGNGTYSPAGGHLDSGGHLDYGETIEECSARELYEETGLIAETNNIEIFCTLNEIYPNKEKHYINIITIIRNFTGEVKNKEPHKLEKWEWLTWDDVKNLGDRNFLPMQNLMKKYPEFDPTKI